MATEPTTPPQIPPTEITDRQNPIDDADWLDWNHWNAIEEYQDLIDGLSSLEIDDDGAAFQRPEETPWSARLARQLRRQGLELED